MNSARSISVAIIFSFVSTTGFGAGESVPSVAEGQDAVTDVKWDAEKQVLSGKAKVDGKLTVTVNCSGLTPKDPNTSRGRTWFKGRDPKTDQCIFEINRHQGDAEWSLSFHTQGKYFAKKKYDPEPLPKYKECKDKLPVPILDGNPGWIKMYWRCWEIAFTKLRKPQEGSGFVSNWLDEGFPGGRHGPRIFQWDTIFMMMFARYGHEVFPAIQSLDNFYCKQYDCGYICREIRETNGIDFVYGGRGNTINPPIFAWAEVESYRLTGDKSRFEMVLPVLEKYAEWLNRDGDPRARNWEENGRISKTAEHRLYWNTPLGSGMDNSPRPTNKGAGWVEMSCQMVIMYNHLAIMAHELGQKEKAEKFRREAKAIGERINKWCWDKEDNFYYDVDGEGKHFRKMTMGGFWPLLAGIAPRERAEKLVGHLKDPKKFWRKMVFPTLAADEKEYVPEGFYWRGGVWAPTNVMVIKGLQKYGYEDFAAEATEKYLAGMYHVFENNKHVKHTVWEVYAPDFLSPAKGGRGSKPHFVGWSGCGPIQLLFENVMGLRPNGINKSLVWKLRRTDRHGVKKLNVGGAWLDLVCDKRDSANSPARVTLKADGNFTVRLAGPEEEKTVELKAGREVKVTVK